jgi:hypothetical protein
MAPLFLPNRQNTESIDFRPPIARIVIPWVFSLLLACWFVGDTTERRR